MSQRLAVILSDKKSATGREQTLLETLAAKLAARDDIQLCRTPSLYDLPAGGEIAKRLAKIGRPLVVLGWLQPRAMFWTLAAHGIGGQYVEKALDWPADPTLDRAADLASRPIWCVDLRLRKSPQALLQRIDAIVAALAPSGNRAAAAMHWTDEDPEGHRWYPVVDADRCQGCLECLNFCLFGVYGLDARQQLFVEQPDACRDGCPACARVCPAKAVIFPMHADPAIAGVLADEPEDSPKALGATAARKPRKAINERRKALVEKVEGERKGKAAPTRRSKAASKDASLKKLDRLVDDLDKFDL